MAVERVKSAVPKKVMTTLTNTGKNPRVVYYSATKTVLLASGESKTVPMLETDIAAFVSNGGPVIVDNESARRSISEDRGLSDQIEGDENEADEGDNEADENDEEPKKTIDDVIAMAKDRGTNFAELVNAAKEVLGEDYPGGNLKKRDIVEALQAKKKSEE